MTNRLAKETSPYLQQHKDNPVDWWPYTQEAFDIAENEEKPVFISIGYSTCHWCHVMEHESFEDPATAAYMNENFVNIKVDREELPGIDKAYQEMYQMLHHRGGGWPLSVWAHPDGSPFYIGTYFPDKSRHGLPSFMEVNQKLADLWQTQRALLDQQAGQLVEAMKSMSHNLVGIKGQLSEDLYYKEIIALQQRFDRQYGGIGQAPKFPRISSLRFLLHEGLHKDIKQVVDFVSFTFHKMAKGGIYDQLGSGFARYSVDRFWLVPHFEKMLYDNGGFIHLGAELANSTNDPLIRFIVKDTIAWLAREMRDERGGFYSAMNADSEGREGTYYVWHDEQVDDLVENIPDDEIAKIQELWGNVSENELRNQLAALIKDRYGITKQGNFKDPHHPKISGMNVLSMKNTISDLAEKYSILEENLVTILGICRKQMFEKRSSRIPPSTDTKIITSWNAIAIRGLLAAAQLLNYPTAGELALQSLEFLLNRLVSDEQVYRSFHHQIKGTTHREIEGILDDYSLLIASCLDAYEYTTDFDYVATAEKILKLTNEKFYDGSTGIYYLNPRKGDDMFQKVIQFSDDSMVSGLSLMVSNLFKLGKYLEKTSYVEMGSQLAQSLAGNIKSYPGAMDSTLIAATPYLRYPTEIVVIGEDKALKQAILGQYVPNRLIYWYKSEENLPKWEVVEHRSDVDEPTVFICKGQTCSLPLTKVDEVIKELNKT